MIGVWFGWNVPLQGDGVDAMGQEMVCRRCATVRTRQGQVGECNNDGGDMYSERHTFRNAILEK